MIPGYDVVLLDRPRPRSEPTDTGQAMFVGTTERGPLTPVLTRSLQAWVDVFGARQAASSMYDAAETFFREGGSVLWTSRVAAAAAAVGSRDLLTAGATVALTVQAAGPGTYSAAQQVRVQTSVQDSAIPAGAFTVAVLEGGNVIETTPAVDDQPSAVAYAAANWTKAKLVLGAGSGDPVAVAASGATNLAGGTDPSVVDADWQAGLDRLTVGLGPGQVAAPGRTTTVGHGQVRDHASARGRHALLDAPDTPTIATVIAAARAADTGTAARDAEMWWPWARIPGLTSTSVRTVPWSAVQAGLCARSDAAGNANKAVAGLRRGVTRWAVGQSQDTSQLTDLQRGQLNDQGVNVSLMFAGTPGPVAYANRTLRLQAVDPLWYQASGSRLSMAIRAFGGAILARYVHEEADGKNIMLGALAGELGGMLGILYEAGALYGLTSEEAFAVDTGPVVNPPEQLEAGLLKASVAFRASPSPEHITLELVRVSIQEEVA